MKTSLLSILSVSALSLFFATSASAVELDLACIANTKAAPGFITRQILIGDDHESVALTDSQGKALVSDRQFAVVIRIVGGTGNKPATEKWTVLVDEDFEFSQGASETEYAVSDLKHKIKYICGLNEEVRANPALSRSN